MIVDDVRQVVCREAIGLDEDLVIDRPVGEDRLAANNVGCACLPCQRHQQPYHVLGSRLAHALRLLVAEGELVAHRASIVLRRDTCRLLALAHLLELLRAVERVVRSSSVDQNLRMLAIDRRALGLAVGPELSTNMRPLVEADAGPCEHLQDIPFGFGDKAGLVGILEPEDTPSAMMARKKVVVERRAQATDMQQTGRRWSKTNTNHKLQAN